jgi:hypothetical protein
MYFLKMYSLMGFVTPNFASPHEVITAVIRFISQIILIRVCHNFVKNIFNSIPAILTKTGARNKKTKQTASKIPAFQYALQSGNEYKRYYRDVGIPTRWLEHTDRPLEWMA